RAPDRGSFASSTCALCRVAGGGERTRSLIRRPRDRRAIIALVRPAAVLCRSCARAARGRHPRRVDLRRAASQRPESRQAAAQILLGNRRTVLAAGTPPRRGRLSLDRISVRGSRESFAQHAGELDAAAVSRLLAQLVGDGALCRCTW